MNPTAAAAPPRRPVHGRATDRVAGHLATLGATLGILAGAIDVAVGPSIRGWVGNKLATTTLGLTTILLSAVALAAAVQWQRSGGRAGDRRLATGLALIVPAGVCFTTIGQLWYVPGALLLAAGIFVLAASTRAELAHAVNQERWLSGLTALLGVYYVFLGADTLPRAAGALGILGGLAVWGALTMRRSPRLALGLLGAGALPFAFATWWSVVTPLMAVLLLTIGRRAVRCRPAQVPILRASSPRDSG